MSGNEKLERELDALLDDDDSRIALLYRKLPRPEPDVGIDSAVLAMARRHASAAPARHPRWLATVGAAAVIVLAAGVVGRLGPYPGPHKPAPLPTGALDKSASGVAPAPPGTAARPPTIPPATPAAEAVQNAESERKPAAFAPVARDRMKAQTDADAHRLQTSAPSAPAAEAAAPEPVPANRRAKRVQENARPSAAPTAQYQHREATATADSLALQRNSRLYPESWLTVIRQLVRDGKHDEAMRNLELFRRKYPDYKLPADLRNLQSGSR